MKRLLFYFYKYIALISRFFSNRSLYMKLIIKAHSSQGVLFSGKPKYIQSNAMLDPLGGLTIENGVVISTDVIILTHDYSCTVGLLANDQEIKNDIAIFKPVKIDKNTFIGAGAIILPGSRIGKYCIIGAGSVVKGIIEDYSIIIGNPAKKIEDTKEWGKSILAKTEDRFLHYDKK